MIPCSLNVSVLKIIHRKLSQGRDRKYCTQTLLSIPIFKSLSGSYIYNKITFFL